VAEWKPTAAPLRLRLQRESWQREIAELDAITIMSVSHLRNRGGLDSELSRLAIKAVAASRRCGLTNGGVAAGLEILLLSKIVYREGDSQL
jgi:hypothetical protein